MAEHNIEPLEQSPNHVVEAEPISMELYSIRTGSAGAGIVLNTNLTVTAVIERYWGIWDNQMEG